MEEHLEFLPHFKTVPGIYLTHSLLQFLRQLVSKEVAVFANGEAEADGGSSS